MKNTLLSLLLTFAFTVSAQQNNTDAPVSALNRKGTINERWSDRANVQGNLFGPEGKGILWYKSPAKVWEEALPLGNGRMGAMVFGGVTDERIQLNEATLWDGYPLDPNNPESLTALPEVQRLLFENRNNEAVALASKTMMGRPQGIKSYQSLGELWFETPVMNAADYTRSLDMPNALAVTKYTADGVEYTRESFVSAADNVVIVRFTASKKGRISFAATLKRQENAECTGVSGDKTSIVLKGRLPVKDKDGKARGLSFAAQVKAVAQGGKISVAGDILTVQNANSVILYIAGATNYPGLQNLAKGIEPANVDPVALCADYIKKAGAKKYDALKSSHIKAHRELYGRVDIDLGPVAYPVRSLPTNDRIILAKKNGYPDAGLIENYFQFGRYLLICSSRPGSMPANLQGIWAWQMNAPWNADFHTNINVQMNYWPAEITNLSEMHRPLFDLMDALVKPGERTASNLSKINAQ